MQQHDILIIGQGLSGSLFAYNLYKNNQSFLLIDNSKINASKVAAGLINPVTGKRLAKTANVDEILPKAVSFYKELETLFNQSFLQERSMLRVLRNESELEVAKKRIKQTEYNAYLESVIENHKELTSSYGVLKQNKVYTLNTSKLLSCLKELFIQNNNFLETEFDYKDLKLSDDAIQWKNYEFQYVVFCEGYRVLKNPYFKWLPLKPVKGEILTVNNKFSALLHDHIINYGYWLIPSGDNNYRTGATFDRDNIDTEITNAAKMELLDKLEKHISNMDGIRVIEQQAGIRPTTPDREPMIGFHPVYNKLYTFNGFGTKGSLLIPYYSQLFHEHFLENKPLPEHADIKRFIDEYFTDSRSA